MSALSGKKILIVEDEFLVALMAEGALAEQGVAVLGPAANAADALKLVEAGAPDAVLLDLNLNGVRSDAVAAALRKSRTPFLLATGYGANPGGGFTEPVLEKPYTEDQLVAALERLLSA